MSDWRDKCDWCGWQLETTTERGCVADDCSFRPRPELSTIGQRQQEIRKLEKQLAKKDQRITDLEVQAKRLLDTLKLAYRKHCLSDEAIGWEELGDQMLDALCEAMGDAIKAWKERCKL